MDEIFIPTMNAMNAENRKFKGCLYFGLMLTPNGPKVIEYNCRFGDPETQVVLPLLETDLLTIMKAVENETLADLDIKFSKGAACCVVMASSGYPQNYEKGYEITVDSDIEADVFIAGATLKDGKLLTSGGRVLGVVATAPDLKSAVDKSYKEVEKVHFGNAFYRKDIGKRALSSLK